MGRSRRPDQSTGTARGLPPEIWFRILAKGHSSTDLIHTESGQGSRSFRYLQAPPRGRTVQHWATTWTGTQRARSEGGARSSTKQRGFTILLVVCLETRRSVLRGRIAVTGTGRMSPKS